MSQIQVIQGAFHAVGTTLDDMGVDHGGGNIRMAQQGLNSTDVRSPL